MQDIYSIRAENLRKILKTRFGGNVAALGRACDRADSQLHRILEIPPGKRLGEKLCTVIEENLGLPAHWLSQSGQEVDSQGLSPEEDLFITLVRREVRTKAIPSHMMQTVLSILETAKPRA